MRRLLDIDLRLIRIFRTITECQGMAGAEVVLNLSQSRISASLAELESRLGVRLCRRGRSGFALTEAGKIIHEASHELFESIDRFASRAGAVSANLKRVLRLGAADAFVTNDELSLSAALRRFRRENPAVVIDFLTAGPDELERQLVAGGRDLAIVPCLNKRAELNYVPLFKEKQSLYCARGHPLFDVGDAEITEARLSSQAFVARGYLHSHDLKQIGHRGAQATIETMEAQLILILSGEFIGYLPAHYARPWVDQGNLRWLLDRKYSYDSTLYAVSQRTGTENPLVRRFLSIVTEAADRGSPRQSRAPAQSGALVDARRRQAAAD